MKLLLAVYKAWPWRPHCSAARHVTLCRLFNGPRLGCDWRAPTHAGYCDPGNEGLQATAPARALTGARAGHHPAPQPYDRNGHPRQMATVQHSRRAAPVEYDELLTVGEVARIFRVTPQQVSRWARAGKLTTTRTLGGHRRYLAGEIQARLKGGQS